MRSPVLLMNGSKRHHGNDWARGFMCGMEFCCEDWGELITDEKQGVWMLPVLMLCHEHDKDPEMRPGPISLEKREEIILQMAAGIVGAYRHFRPQRERAASTYVSEPRSGIRKIGRNEPCPCGSGKKYKRCCGGATIQ